jgi:putative transposase
VQYGRPHTKGDTFFFTVSTLNRLPFLCTATGVQSMREALRTVGRSHPFSLNAFVLLPDHLHCLWTLPGGDSDFTVRWAEIKGHFSRTLGSSAGQEYPEELWSPGLGERRILDDRDFVRHVEYIHYNPVKHGLVAEPRAWPHSTFLRYVERGLYLPDWGSPEEPLLDGATGSE